MLHAVSLKHLVGNIEWLNRTKTLHGIIVNFVVCYLSHSACHSLSVANPENLLNTVANAAVGTKGKQTKKTQHKAHMT